MIPGLAPAEEIKDPAARRYCEQLTEIMSIILGRAGDPADWLMSRGQLRDIKVIRMNDEAIWNPNAPEVTPVAVPAALPLVDLFDNSGELIVDNDGGTVQYEV